MARHYITWRSSFRRRRRPCASSVREGRTAPEPDRAAAANRPLFPGIIGYDDTVVPQVVTAILSKHNFILLGLRGQAKTRMLRALADLLDPEIAVVPGCEIHDDPLAPLCAACRARVATEGDDMPIALAAPANAATSKSSRRRTSRLRI